MVEPTEVFKSVWYKREEAAVKTLGLAWDDTGTLKVFPDHIEYSGRKNTFGLGNIRAAQIGKFGGNPFHRWVKVHFVHDGRMGSLLLSAKGSTRGQNRQLLTALQDLIEPPQSQEEVRAIAEFLSAERAAAFKRYSTVIRWGALNIALGVALGVWMFPEAGALSGFLAVVVLVTGIGMCIDGTRGRSRTRGD